jgi:RNA recognition motif-containing protein
MTNIFICGMDPSISHKQLIAAFEQFGTVEKAFIPLHRDGEFEGESRGFGFVEMSDAADAQNAIETLNGSEWRGLRIKVCIARSPTKPRHDRPNAGPDPTDSR